jgi:hypothetical protein
MTSMVTDMHIADQEMAATIEALAPHRRRG